MEGKDRYSIHDINLEIGESLRKIIEKHFLKDDKYCEELDLCLTGEKGSLTLLNLKERREWIINNWHNEQRGYIIKTFTYYWLYKLCLQGKDYYLDDGWRHLLSLYFKDDKI